jgi:hypothetical protein
MASSSKKVILRTLENALHFGYLPVSGLVVDGAVPLLGLDARILSIALETVRSIAYVRDFNLNDKDDPERLVRRTFMARPRAEGLWLRLTLTGGDIFEGLAPLDLALADGLLEDRGLFLLPPDMRSNTQRLYIPRAVITNLQLLAVITTPSKSKPEKTAANPQDDWLFPQ